jgi:hypothetical protein
MSTANQIILMLSTYLLPFINFNYKVAGNATSTFGFVRRFRALFGFVRRFFALLIFFSSNNNNNVMTTMTYHLAK